VWHCLLRHFTRLAHCFVKYFRPEYEDYLSADQELNLEAINAHFD
jgi:hypothetical protein